MMTKQEMEKAIAEKLGKTQKEASEFYDAFIETIKEEAGSFNSDDVKISLFGLGIISIKRKEAYDSKNPRTGEPVAVAESRRITFKAGKAFKDAVNSTTPVKKTASKAVAKKTVKAIKPKKKIKK